MRLLLCVLWWLRQLFPMTYRARYIDLAGYHFTVWKMWFGRCYKIDDVLVECETDTSKDMRRIVAQRLGRTAAETIRRVEDYLDGID